MGSKEEGNMGTAVVAALADTAAAGVAGVE